MALYFLRDNNGNIIEYDYLTSVQAKKVNKLLADRQWLTSKQILERWEKDQVDGDKSISSISEIPS